MLRRRYGARAAQAGRVVRLTFGVDRVTRLGGLPAGTLDLAAHLGGLSPEEAERELFLPLDLGAWGPPVEPRPAPGGGWVCCELGAPGDEDTFARLLETLPPDADAPTVAAAAQHWRLPVNEYRCRAPQPATPPELSVKARGIARVLTDSSLGGVRIVDMTVMWAGPLATRKLAELGADVVKVEPECRMDGTRGSAMFDALNAGKRRADLDLRDTAQRAEFMDLVRDADVVIDNFSPRVMPNLGLTHNDLLAVNPRIISVSMPAFPAGSPWRDRVSYGVGVHALSGLGDNGDGTFSEPSVAYPDPLAGLAAYATVLELLDRGVPTHAEVAMFDVVAQLQP
ncbi:MAG TPA: CoA transferase [Acidimicrobiales bacterium]|nr:CoA transferase [Acidimicrobiales bacterium]